MTAQEELQQLYRLRELLDSKCALRQDKYDLVLKVTSNSSGMPKSGGNNDKMASAVAACADLSKEIDVFLAQYLSLQNELRKKIERIKEKDYRLVLELRYLQFKKFRQIANIMDCSEEKIYKDHKNALYLYSKIQ